MGEKRNHPGSKLRQGFWMVFRFGVNNWGYNYNDIQVTCQVFFKFLSQKYFFVQKKEPSVDFKLLFIQN
ncbi:hypothetical protein AKJ00_10325 [Streptococcus pneumoniae]|nr:hypothetical protein AKJ00_10325 [Streptococcus pneumoniae]